MVQLRQRDNGILALEGEATAEHAEALHRSLCDIVARVEQQTVTVELAGLTGLDIAGAQILLALKRSHGPRQVHLTGCPPQLARRLRHAGLESALLSEGRER